jgi:hypothetical protein
MTNIKHRPCAFYKLLANLVPNLPPALIKLKQKSPNRITKHKIPTIKAKDSGPFQIFSIPKTSFLDKINDTEN